MKLRNRTALVTGGSRGIGRAVALALGREGANVAVNWHSARPAAEDVVAGLRACGRNALAVQADVSDLEAVKRMAAAVEEGLGPIDILVNSAGIVRDNPVTFMKEEEWREVLAVDLTGVFHCIKVVGKEMARRRSGRIINISSVAGLLGDAMRANYAAAKAGLLGLTKTVAREFAPSGVTVNAVAPGIIETDLISGLSESRRKLRTEAIPQGRFGRPEEVAGAVVFLASDDAGYITGAVVCVDGGLWMKS